MATSYTTSLRLSEPTPGDPLVKNQWGTILNTNMVLIDSAVTGTASVNIGGLTSYSLTVGNGSADQARCQFYSFSGALTGDCTVTMPNVPKVVWAANLTTGGHNVILTTGGGTTVTLPNNSTWALIRCDGTNVSNMSVQFSGTVASSLTASGAISGGSGFIATAADAGGFSFRAISGTTAVGVRNDGTNAYLMDSATAMGGFTTHRPFMWNLSTAAVTIDGTGAGTTFGGGITSNGACATTGYKSRGGVSGGFTSNYFNLFWSGTAAYLYVDNTQLGTFAYVSDPRVKKNITDVQQGALDRVMSWRVVEYEIKDVGIFRADGKRIIGFLATQIQTITPSAVSGEADAVDDNGNVQPQSLNPLPMIAELAAALQELRREVAALKGG